MCVQDLPGTYPGKGAAAEAYHLFTIFTLEKKQSRIRRYFDAWTGEKTNRGKTYLGGEKN